MRPLLLIPVLLGLAAFPAKAGEKMFIDKSLTEIETPFDQGKLEWQSNSGAFFSLNHSDRPTIDYSSTSYRIGRMLNTPAGSGFFRGNYELMLQLFGGSVFEDHPGNYLFGAAVVVRYNFVQPETNWVPYCQVGVGAVYNDIYKDRSQRLIGQQWEADLEAALGIRYFLNSRWSANLEGAFRHLSNGNNSDRNVGLNSIGVGVGLGYHF